ncbi:YhcB family protein [Candidatus Sororendozoicomonas aggregata]|uniref:YhcB family protein n=1 Tax=Candidatus Sororendozoicomonas aggregata TaxID=3073239 RepID=UPI002ED66653
MDNINEIWLVGSLAFLVGALCGALLYHIFAGSNARNGKLTSQLDDVQREYMEYKDKVSDHFTTTAHLINKMTDTYKEVHEHMANGADSLCQNESVHRGLGDALLRSNSFVSGKLTKGHTVRSKTVEQPKDYAPKNKPEEKGMLSEEFGISSRADVVKES